MPKFAISTETAGDRVRVIIREATTGNKVFAFWGTEDNIRQLNHAADEIWRIARQREAQEMQNQPRRAVTEIPRLECCCG